MAAARPCAQAQQNNTGWQSAQTFHAKSRSSISVAPLHAQARQVNSRRQAGTGL